MVKWQKEVQPLVGETKMYIFPFRAAVFDKKLDILKAFGFRIFYGVGPRAYERFMGNSFFASREHIDGISLRTESKLLADLFGISLIADPLRPAQFDYLLKKK